ncbi:MAG: DUF4386 domain-containing protein [Crocinitomicaceae bacterium]
MDQNNTLNQVNKARIVGALFLLAFLFYGIGRNLFESEVVSQKYLGTSMIVINSIIVVFIGALLRKTTIKFNIFVGNLYLFSRVIEAIGLLSIVLSLFTVMSFSLDYGYFIAMLSLGIGSIPLCYVFYKNDITPKWLTMWGIIGYTFFTFGFLMELFGKEWSMYLLILGGLWEVTFAIWLILKREKYER